MNTCIKCDVEMDDYRLHLGYKECTDCSEEEEVFCIRCIHIRQVVMISRNQDEPTILNEWTDEVGGGKMKGYHEG